MAEGASPPNLYRVELMVMLPPRPAGAPPPPAPKASRKPLILNVRGSPPSRLIPGPPMPAPPPARKVLVLADSKPPAPEWRQVPLCKDEVPLEPPVGDLDPTMLLVHPVAPPPQPVGGLQPEVAKMEPPQVPPETESMVHPSATRRMEEELPLWAEAVELPPLPPAPTTMR